MDAERYQRLKHAVSEAAGKVAEEREACLLARCGDDTELLEEARRLLAAATVATSALAPPLLAEAPPTMCGGYRLGAEIGRGGMGAVYDARAADGTRVAVKLVHPHLAAVPRLRERFLREAELGSQVEHPCVVRTLAAGAENGRPYLVMEHVEGETLRRLLDELGTVPERLVREIAAQVAEGLAAIHDAGIVHRDLKPENVLVTERRRVRIMDLGVAKLQEASLALTEEGQFVGSLHYAAPEQCEGGEVGPAADLYALGVVLYELATGENPFRHETPTASLRAHMDHAPESARRRNPDVSPFLSEVIGTLLAKDPSDRFPSARALSRVLAEGERGIWWTSRERERGSVGSPRVAVRRESRLHGREAELERLQAAWREARDGRGGALLLEGEPGIGKSRLIDAFLDGLAREEAHVLYGSFPPSGGMRGLTEAVLGAFGGGRLEEALAPYLTRSAGLVKSFAALLRRETPARPLETDAFEGLCCDLARALAAERPTVWIADDLHFASQEARAAALALAHAAAPHRLLVVLSARPGLPQEELLRFTRGERCARVPLPRLSPRAVLELLREVLGGRELAERLGGRIAYKSDGVPFFIFEMVRDLVEKGVLRRLRDGRFEQTRDVGEFEVPSAVRDLVAARLRELARDERALLDVAAVHGYEFDAEVVAEALDRPLVGVLQDLAEIERRRGIVRAAGRLHRFDHHQIQEVLYADLPQRLREEYHALVAGCLAKRAGDSRREALSVARHALRGSRPDDALPWLPYAFEHLAAGHRHEEEVALVRDALRIVSGPQRIDLLLRAAAALDMRGRRDEQKAALDEALTLAEGAARPRVLSELGAYHHAVGEFAEARRRFQEALSGREDAAILCRLGALLVDVRDDAARRTLVRARRLAMRAGDVAVRAMAERFLGLELRRLNRYRAARAHFERSRDLAKSIGDARNRVLAEGNLGALAWRAGRMDEALTHVERARTWAEQSGNRRAEAVMAGNLALLLFDQGRFAEQLRCLRRQLDVSREIRDLVAETHALLELGRLFGKLGRPEAALDALDRAAANAREMDHRRYAGIESVRRGAILHALHHDGEARTCCERALAIFREDGDLDNVAAVLVTLGIITRDPAQLEEAAALADRLDSPSTLVYALARRLSLPGADPEPLSRRLPEFERTASVLSRMEAHYYLHGATGDSFHAREAVRLLDFVREHAPPDARESLVSSVPVHRAVAALSQ